MIASCLKPPRLSPPRGSFRHTTSNSISSRSPPAACRPGSSPTDHACHKPCKRDHNPAIASRLTARNGHARNNNRTTGSLPSPGSRSSQPGHSPPGTTRTVIAHGHPALDTSPACYYPPPRSRPAPSVPSCPCTCPPVYRPRPSPSPSARSPPRNTRTRLATRLPTPGKASLPRPRSSRALSSPPSRSRASFSPGPFVSPRDQAGCCRNT